MLFGLLVLSLFVSVMINGEIDSVYQLPKDAYGMVPEWSSLLDLVPYVIVLCSIALVIVTIVLWKRKNGGIFARMHYTLYTGTALFLVWLFSFWNIL